MSAQRLFVRSCDFACPGVKQNPFPRSVNNTRGALPAGNRTLSAALTFATMIAAPSSVSPGKFSGSGSTWYLPRVRIGTHHTRTVSELFSFNTCLGWRRFCECACDPWLIHPLPPFLAKAMSLAFFCVRGSMELHKSHQTRFSLYHLSVCCSVSVCFAKAKRLSLDGSSKALRASRRRLSQQSSGSSS